MVNKPKKDRKFCPKCNQHRIAKVSIYKKSAANPNRQGSRRYRIKQKGFGGQTKPIQRRTAKNTKKPVLIYTFEECHHKAQKLLKRAKQVMLSNTKKVKGEVLTY